MVTIILACILAYLFGSIPTAVWVGKAIKGIDVRDYGSGNAGATNSLRVLGAGIAVPVLLVDILKGLLATRIMHIAYFTHPLFDEFSLEFKLLLGICAVAGHIFPLFAQFKGGKGIATLTGVVVGLHPLSALFVLIIFIVTVTISRFVSLGSILAAVAYPFVLIGLFNNDELFVVIFATLIPVIVIITHRKNIRRLIRKEESKISFAKHKN